MMLMGVQALLPVRLGISAAAAPAFARFFPNLVRRMTRRAKKKSS